MRNERCCSPAPTRRASPTPHARDGEHRLQVPRAVRREAAELVRQRPVEVAGRQHEVDELAAGPLDLGQDA